jgi:hypothetical protein
MVPLLWRWILVHDICPLPLMMFANRFLTRV